MPLIPTSRDNFNRHNPIHVIVAVVAAITVGGLLLGSGYGTQRAIGSKHSSATDITAQALETLGAATLVLTLLQGLTKLYKPALPVARPRTRGTMTTMQAGNPTPLRVVLPPSPMAASPANHRLWLGFALKAVFSLGTSFGLAHGMRKIGNDHATRAGETFGTLGAATTLGSMIFTLSQLIKTYKKWQQARADIKRELVERANATAGVLAAAASTATSQANPLFLLSTYRSSSLPATAGATALSSPRARGRTPGSSPTATGMPRRAGYKARAGAGVAHLDFAAGGIVPTDSIHVDSGATPAPGTTPGHLRVEVFPTPPALQPVPVTRLNSAQPQPPSRPLPPLGPPTGFAAGVVASRPGAGSKRVLTVTRKPNHHASTRGLPAVATGKTTTSAAARTFFYSPKADGGHRTPSAGPTPTGSA